MKRILRLATRAALMRSETSAAAIDSAIVWEYPARPPPAAAMRPVERLARPTMRTLNEHRNHDYCGEQK
jgi:hypothetical protein